MMALGVNNLRVRLVPYPPNSVESQLLQAAVKLWVVAANVMGSAVSSSCKALSEVALEDAGKA